MARRLIHTTKNLDRTVKVYRDPDWQEYQCELFIGDKHQKDATHHTTDRAEALGTAEAMVRA